MGKAKPAKGQAGADSRRGLVERLKSGPRDPRRWFELLPPEAQQELREVRRLVRSGEIKASAIECFRTAQDVFGKDAMPRSITSFNRFMDAVDDGET